ncbi:hypothetical protein CVT26_004829 [Gymnopilus dilepis]|uniref:Uncharacterized protein n=1 Tax=Gymnopilus dilepis TaxID=231916 RepID=A0A409XZQ3_9AGAR|nr:hypothetical protein CVT26_004829 [Gymnopilus dilepis]
MSVESVSLEVNDLGKAEISVQSYRSTDTSDEQFRGQRSGSPWRIGYRLVHHQPLFRRRNRVLINNMQSVLKSRQQDPGPPSRLTIATMIAFNTAPLYKLLVTEIGIEKVQRGSRDLSKNLLQGRRFKFRVTGHLSLEKISIRGRRVMGKVGTRWYSWMGVWIERL